jgi:hypothetical protein
MLPEDSENIPLPLSLPDPVPIHATIRSGNQHRRVPRHKGQDKSPDTGTQPKEIERASLASLKQVAEGIAGAVPKMSTLRAAVLGITPQAASLRTAKKGSGGMFWGLGLTGGKSPGSKLVLPGNNGGKANESDEEYEPNSVSSSVQRAMVTEHNITLA